MLNINQLEAITDDVVEAAASTSSSEPSDTERPRNAARHPMAEPCMVAIGEPNAIDELLFSEDALALASDVA